MVDRFYRCGGIGLEGWGMLDSNYSLSAQSCSRRLLGCGRARRRTSPKLHALATRISGFGYFAALWSSCPTDLPGHSSWCFAKFHWGGRALSTVSWVEPRPLKRLQMRLRVVHEEAAEHDTMTPFLSPK